MNRITKDAKERRLPSLLRAIGAAAVLSVGFAMPAGAVTINGGLVPGVQNGIEDQDREAYIDVDGSGTINVGDVLIGFVRVDNFQTSGLSSNNQVYGIISNQIIGAVGGNPNLVQLGVTTTVGLRLQDITGDANTAGGMIAIYDRSVPFSADLIVSGAPAATGINDDINLITAQGTLRLVSTITAADDYLYANVDPGFGIGAPNAGLIGLPDSISFGGFRGGMNFIYNNTNFLYLDAVPNLDQLGVAHLNQLSINRGTFGGSANDTQSAVFTNAGAYGFAQCTTALGAAAPCGFVTDADFSVRPVAVPEPGSLVLLGAALLGLGGLRRRRKV